MIDVIKRRKGDGIPEKEPTMDTSFETITDSVVDTSKGVGTDDKEGGKSKDWKDIFKKKPPFTLSFLLNLIDGLQENHGRILVMTTNCYDTIDPALLRDGRIDLTIDMNNADIATVKEAYQSYYETSMPEDFAQKLIDIEIMHTKFQIAWINIFIKSSGCVFFLGLAHYMIHFFESRKLWCTELMSILYLISIFRYL